MTDQDNTWVGLMTAGMALAVIGFTMLETTAWFVQYGALGSGLVLVLFSFYLATTEAAPE